MRIMREEEVCVFSSAGLETEQGKMKRKGSWHYLTANIMLCNLSIKKAKGGRLAENVSAFCCAGGQKMAVFPF